MDTQTHQERMAVQVPVPTSTFTLVRVFLASPGDLGDERKAARDAVDEINKTIARPAGFHVDLIGWEDTISERRRPQEIINEDLESCEMFVGMMWKKWGTPPDTSGEFTSGFEEEFSLASKLYDKSASPIMRLYFKHVETSLLNDPGDDLKKVLAFRKEIENQKKTYFETFSDSTDFARRMRISIADYINKLRLEMQREQESFTDSPKRPSKEEEDREQQEDNLPTLVQARFLAELATEIADPDGEASALEVARLRNIANTFAHSQNDEFTLGAHDANILYAFRGTLTLSDPEIANLADAGLAAFTSDNLPVWYWVGNRLFAIPEWLALSTIVSSGKVQIGAFRALSLIGQEIPEQIISQSREEFLDAWFADEVPEGARVEALRYLGAFGRSGDRRLIERELSKKDGTTLSVALEAQIALLLRYDGAAAVAEFALANSFEELSADAMEPVLAALSTIDTKSLQESLAHRSAAIRFRALCMLHDRGAITSDRAQELFSDPALLVREKAVSIVGLLEDRRWSREDARPILIRQRASNVFGSTGSYDWEGEDAVERLQVDELINNPKVKLQAAANSGTYSWFLAYQALSRKHFSSFAATVRSDFDNRFQRRFDKYVQATRELAVNATAVEPLIQQMLGSERFTRREWMRKAADILVERLEATDLSRLRKALDDDDIDPSIKDIPFLASRGEWEDVKRIEKIYSDYRSRGYPASILGYKAPALLASKALLRLASKRASELLKSDLPGDLIAAVAYQLSKANFLRMSDLDMMGILSHKDDAVRKVVALRIVQDYKPNRTRRIAETYADQSYRYYNVIRWLDLAFGLDPALAKLAAKRELARFASKWAQ